MISFDNQNLFEVRWRRVDIAVFIAIISKEAIPPGLFSSDTEDPFYQVQV